MYVVTNTMYLLSTFIEFYHTSVSLNKNQNPILICLTVQIQILEDCPPSYMFIHLCVENLVTVCSDSVLDWCV